MVLIFFVLLALLDTVVCESLIDGIVHVECGLFEENLATITYFGDSYMVSAYMQDGRSCPFEQDVATATWRLDIHLFVDNDLENEASCVMTQLPRRHIYSVRVTSRRRSVEFESEDDERFLMECNFDPYKEEQDEQLSLIDILDPPKVIAVQAGKTSNSNFSIELIGMEGQKLTSVVVGSVVRLLVKESASREDNGLGFEPVICHALTPDAQQMATILADGCGTGYPFNRERGFQMDRTIGISPPFRMFRLHPFKNVNFKCTFITCSGDCQGSTCAAENITSVRPRRNTDIQIVRGRTDFQTVEFGDLKGDALSDAITEELLSSSAVLDTLADITEIKLPTSGELPLDYIDDGIPSDWLETNQRIIVIGDFDTTSAIETIKLTLMLSAVIIVAAFIVAIVFFVIKIRKMRY